MKLSEAIKKVELHPNSILSFNDLEFVYINNKYPLVYRKDAAMMFNPTPEQLLSDKWKVKLKREVF